MEEFGPPEVLTLHTLPVPLPGPSEVLIELHAAGVGVWDASVRDGSWKPAGKPKFPLVPGTDGAGTVVLRGSRVRRFDVGDRVWAYHYANPKGGFYAEYVAVDVAHVGNMPRRLDFEQAGAGATTGLTALQGIDDALRVGRGENVLIFGATGAVGTLAIQFAKRRHARVIATASDKDGAELVRKLGADEVLDPRSSDAAERLQQLAPDGINAALVLAGSEILETCLDLVQHDGRIAYPNGVSPEPRKRRKIQVIAYNAEPGPKEFERLEHAAAQARLTVPIAETFPLEQAAKAHERLQQGHILGRIVLRIRRGNK
jgi:NADPH:quinone reductase-like Zn-dependent oxidoreductase